MRIIFNAGELAIVHPNYHSGIWLRNNICLPVSDVTGHIPSASVVTILEIVDNNVKVISKNGLVGWTWKNRLIKA